MDKFLNKKRKLITLNHTHSSKRQNNRGHKSGFGLKEISNRVKEIITRLRTTSYKEISEQIVNEINEKSSKDEKNIRRRIYDSLNVMKSIKLFQKDKTSKKIVSNFNANNNNQQNNFKDNANGINHASNREELSKMSKEIAEKKNKLTNLQKELESLNILLERNKKCNLDIEEKKKIYFPFIIIEFPENLKYDNSRIKVSMNEDKTQVHFAFDSANKLYGDLDAILKIGRNIKSTSDILNH